MVSTSLAPQSPFVLTLGLDLTDTASSRFSFDQAALIGSRIAQSHIHVVYVLCGDAGADVTREADGLLKKYVSEKWTALGRANPQVFGIHVRRGDAAREITKLAAEVSSDMIIVGNHKVPHLKTIFMGSTAARVMAAATCPVLVAGPRPQPTPTHMIVIDPPCPACVELRAATGGHPWWCERHSECHPVLGGHVCSHQSALPIRA
jgi:nucleotide-binding universal stress UspA family protein